MKEKTQHISPITAEIKKSSELKKSKIHIVVEVLHYIPNSVVSKTILKKTNGNITIVSFAIGEESEYIISPFDIYIQIIDGAAELTIGKKKHHLKTGNGIIIPAHTKYCFNAKTQFKIVSTLIKNT
jgi:quercetin dioxygenase-like cupin family protein